MPEISPHAIVEPTAELADDVTVGPFCYVGPKVRIGSGSRIANNVTIQGRTTLGQRTTVFPMCVIGAPPAGVDDDAGECVLGEANAIREHVTIYGGLDKPTVIGNHNLIMIASQIGPGAALGDHGIFDNCTKIGAAAIIEDYVRMSGFAAVADGVRVGAYAFVAGYAGVADDSPPYAMLQGYPVRVRGLNTRNLKACGFGEQDIGALKSAFRELFNGRGQEVKRDVLERLVGDPQVNPYVRRLTDALQAGLAKAGAEAGNDD
jgi:UDP-N-acetylglucosamine acyltransferase